MLAAAAPAADAIDAAFAGRSYRVILGRGTARPAADMGALTLKEGAALGCEAQDPAAFRHGPLELAGPGLGAVIIALDPATVPLDAGLAAEIAAAGSGVVLIGPARTRGRVAAGKAAAPVPVTAIPVPAVDPLLAPAVALPPLQLLAHLLAVRAGREPGVLLRAAKVTLRE